MCDTPSKLLCGGVSNKMTTYFMSSLTIYTYVNWALLVLSILIFIILAAINGSSGSIAFTVIIAITECAFLQIAIFVLLNFYERIKRLENFANLGELENGFLRPEFENVQDI